MGNKPEGSGDGVGAVDPAVQIEHLVGYVLSKQCSQFTNKQCPNKHLNYLNRWVFPVQKKSSRFKDKTDSETFFAHRSCTILSLIFWILTSVSLGLTVCVFCNLFVFAKKPFGNVSRNLKSCKYDPFVPECRNVKERKRKYKGGRGKI